MGYLATAKAYLRENWGAPFVVAFLVLLVVSTGQLSFGPPDTASGSAMYAFYALMLGVVLQAAAHLRYQGGEEELRNPASVDEQRRPMSKRQKFAAIGVLVLILLGMGTAVVAYYHPAISYKTTTLTIVNMTSGTATTLTQSTTQTFTRSWFQIYPPLTAKLNFRMVLKPTINTTIATFGVSASGGSTPYTFIAQWGDHISQVSASGVFTRTFLSNQTMPTSAEVTVASNDGQVVVVTVAIGSRA